MRNALKFFFGSVSVYLIMAACSGGGSKSNGSGDGSSNSGTAGSGMAMSGRGSGGNAGNAVGGNGVGGSVSDGSMMDVIMDVFTDPVPDADAQTPQEDTVTCLAGQVTSTATINYPGATVRELSNIVVYGTLTTPTTAGFGYARPASIYFKDGSVMVDCGLLSNPTYSAITFIRP
jgi:hypothetical protein